MSTKRQMQKAAEATAWNPLSLLSGWGIRSSHAYTAGFVSIAISFLSWLISRKKDDAKPQSDRWGLFVGEWAPTFFALGIALKHEE
ncbi:hypothetical protein [Glutamicibacter protophormiae]|uniref:hypothetical protein n=1 Tax=Glutamicibacter protophormiae TaxID=37930 RepID=UPI003A90BA8A